MICERDSFIHQWVNSFAKDAANLFFKVDDEESKYVLATTFDENSDSFSNDSRWSTRTCLKKAIGWTMYGVFLSGTATLGSALIGYGIEHRMRTEDHTETWKILAYTGMTGIGVPLVLLLGHKVVKTVQACRQTN